MAAMAAFDEMRSAPEGVRAPYRAIDRWLQNTPMETIEAKRREVDAFYHRAGITFGAYGAVGGHETTIPFDIIPRVIAADEWAFLERGLSQRVRALNAFLADAYGAREICRAGIIPEAQLLLNGEFAPLAQDLKLPGDIHVHIAGIDMVRVGEQEFYVLEDNVRTPSGISYVLENREVMMRLAPELFSRMAVRPVASYTEELLNTLRSVSFSDDGEPNVVLLTPGHYNSAYFEHAFLADEMGIELVEGTDLFVDEGRVFMRTPRGPQRVDVIYRRIDDSFLDPLAFRPDSFLGVPGLVGALRMGRVNVVNAIGNGVADDKSTYLYVPDMIRFYLSEEPILRNVPTWRGDKADDFTYILEHLPEIVVKEVHGSGGKGMLVGPTSTKTEIEEFRALLKARPDAYIAQPTLALSTCPTFVDQGVAPRHVDLRPFILSRRSGEVFITPGGLTRVALKEGSLVVNSSQGGGTKDTWVLGARGDATS
ncbi:circularly permuted type 2 ATP-grasp protein [Reyranella sp. CPCC 100927]|uniref:circularly permuted type 2 ATP-grasp protein n=1 Tax=Reyranella sp. CPCC 100927 TaxID=2599616 RepID=UPI0011B6E995|nr:circularly permuted type 2 ATP-grasp protein [Reyranella sp. CPCC 100927]